MPQSNDNCLEILMCGEMVIIFAEGLIPEINFAVFPVTEKPMIASTLMLQAMSLIARAIALTGSLLI